jgi:hypothetical protein
VVDLQDLLFGVKDHLDILKLEPARNLELLTEQQFPVWKNREEKI